MKHIKDLAGQTMIYGLSSIVSRFLNYLLTPIFTYVFLPGEFGDVTILYAYATFLTIVLTYGFETGFFYFVKKHHDSSEVFGTAFLSILFTSLLFICGILYFLPSVSSGLGYSGKSQYIILFTLFLAFDSISAIPFAKLRQQNQAFKFGIYKLLNVLITIFFTLLFVIVIPHFLGNDSQFLGFHFHLSINYIFIANLIGSAFTLLLFLPDMLRSKIKFSFKLWTSMFNYSYPLMFAGFIGTVNEVIDRILLQIYLPSNVDIKAQIGIYGACVKIAVLMTLFTQMFRFAAEPFFFNRTKSLDQKQILADVSKFFVIYGLIIFLGVMSYIDIIKYFIGPSFHEGISVVWISMLGSLGLGIYFNLSFWYKLNGKTYFGLIITAIGAFLTVVLNILLIPRFGYYGSAWARAICYIIIVLISYFLGQYYYPINYDIKSISKYFVLCLILFVFCYYFKFQNLYLNIFKNTVLLGAFIFYLEHKEHIISIFIKSNESTNS